MQLHINPAKSEWANLLKRQASDVSELSDLVKDILQEIKRRGDEAVKEYAKKFDNFSEDSFIVTQSEIDNAEATVSQELKDAITKAANNIRVFHESQKTSEKKIETSVGVTCWQRSVGIEKVGLYIPGGTAPLFSTVLMLAIPAQIAGCKDIILSTPPDKDGKINPVILFAAKVAGVNRIFKVGGVQAIGAMAYGTETIPQVYKIFGPGNKYVTAAKQIVSLSDVAIDMPAGPSEVLVMADKTANPQFVAADLLSQAEHGADSQVILLSDSKSIIDETLIEVEKQLDNLPRKEETAKALESSRAFLLNDIDEMIEMSNQYAPEHLILALDDFDYVAEKIVNAGSVFMGHYTPESAGDYASGTNHTLPTNGYAKMYSGVNLDSFVRKVTYQKITKEGLQDLGPTVEIMAEAELLQAHKNAVTVRLNSIK